MSRRRNAPNNVTGPSSALTSFLREHGIQATTAMRYGGQGRAQAAQNAANAPAPAQPTNGTGDTEDAEQQEEQVDDNAQEEQEVVQGSSRRRTNGYTSDNLDDSDDDGNPAQKKKRKLTKAAEAKLKAKEKAKRKKAGKGSDAEDDKDDDDDPYTAKAGTGKGVMAGAAGGPAATPGSRIMCVDCDKLFTVTKYTLAGDHGGFLCHPCAKKSGKNPFAKQGAPKKRKPAADKRKVVHYEEAEPVKSLTSLCIEMIGKFIEDVEALGDIGAVNMDLICKIVSKSRMLNAHNVQLFYDTSRTSLTIYDGTNLQSPSYEAMAALNPNLRRLHIHCCGQLETSALISWSQPTTLAHLTRIELYAPFLVRVEGWKEFITQKGPQLKGFLITNSPRFDIDCLVALQEHCSSQLEELRLAEIGKLDDTWLPYLSTFESLTSLDLSRGAKSLEDEAVIELLSKVGPQLELLDLSGNDELTDEFLAQGLGRFGGRIKTLKLSGLIQMTDDGVSNFFKSWVKPGENTDAMEIDADYPAITNPALIHLDLSQCHLLSSFALVSILAHSGLTLETLSINGWKEVETRALKRICFSAPNLRELDLGWCRNVDDFIVAGLFGNQASVVAPAVDGAGQETAAAEGESEKELREEVRGKVVGCDKLKVLKVYGCNRLTVDCPRKRDVSLLGIESDVYIRT